MEIRGHHLLCMLGFIGLGYNEKFILNMDKIIKKLNNKHNMWIKLVDNVDNICAACPNNINEECKIDSFPGSVKERDRAVLKVLGIEVGEVVRYRDIVNKISERMTEEKMMNICKDCEWFGLGYCLEGLKKLKGG
ncbi:DUF1284 domain-containing protein [Aceticella autotrophica]|uniref:DUF1284 domain-containing protein n=1 Tax=Aceticella autotrophica TaxID=2755338 RepID=A0A975GBA3_9THEO|nr:DUF1284 domain-containing protein [Aceticella autotrophica]QSZ28238.1 DUF1284 domain-containing protein [Aceticella autotrophica]